MTQSKAARRKTGRLFCLRMAAHRGGLAAAGPGYGAGSAPARGRGSLACQARSQSWNPA